MAFLQLLVIVIGVSAVADMKGGASAAATSLLSITLDGKDTLRGSIEEVVRRIVKVIVFHTLAQNINFNRLWKLLS